MATAVRSSELIVSPQIEVDTPALVVSEDILHRNIAGMATLAKRGSSRTSVG